MTYIIKFADQTFLTKPERYLYGNFLSDKHYSQFDRGMAIRFNNLEEAEIVANIVSGVVDTLETTLLYEVGKTYLTIKGDEFLVVADKGNCVCNEKGQHRYNRKDGGYDNGRTTGSKWTEDCLRYPPEEVLK